MAARERRAGERSHPAGSGSLGAWVRRERVVRGLSQAYLAARAGLEPARLDAIERGAALLRQEGRDREVADALARALGVHPEEALCRLAPPVAPAPPGRARWRAFGLAASLLAVAGVAWIALPGVAGAPEEADEADRAEPAPRVVYRVDYVAELLEERE